MMATRLFGFYRASEANDPEVFIAGATAILAQYPEMVVRQVCDPVRGMPGQDKWLPSIAEIRMACERAMAPRYSDEKRERERAHTRAVLGGHKAAAGSSEHQRVLKGFKDLGEALAAKNATADPRPKAVHVAGRRGEADLRRQAEVNTPEFAAYLDRMRAQEGSVAGAEGIEF